MKHSMLIRTPADLGATLRDRRKELGLDQAGLAEKIGVNRKWIIGIERGRARAELGLVLRTINALGLNLDLSSGTPKKKASTPLSTGADIDAIIADARKAKR